MKKPQKNKFKKKEISDQKLNSINKAEEVMLRHFKNIKKCKDLKCYKIERIDSHFKKCCKAESCRWCKEYFALLCYHTLHRCDNYLNCVIPYCIAIGLKYKSLNIKVRKIIFKSKKN